MTENLILIAIGTFCLTIGVILGYYTRQSLAKKRAGTIEAKLQEKVSQAKKEAEEILEKSKERAKKIEEKISEEIDQRRREVIRAEHLLLKREENLANQSENLEHKEKELKGKIEKIKEIRESLAQLQDEAKKKLEEIAGLSDEEAKNELFKVLEQEYQADVLQRIRKLEANGVEQYEKRAKEILAQAIQSFGMSQAQEITTTSVSLPSDEIKGRIIGKEGRNIRAFEQASGVELIVDETPEVVMISSFNPIRREVAKIALEKLIKDGRIQPARIESEIEKAEKEVNKKIKEAGEAAVYETEILNLPEKLVHLLGRLHFRTSYGQNVLLHSIEVAHLAGTIAEEIGANSAVAKKAGLLHDIGKALDWQMEGSHTDIGIKILEKFGIEKEVINAMKSHHEEYPYETIEARIVQTADQISGARPGARKDTLENYLKRLEDLEDIATSFSGVKKAYAITAGREIRVFVSPEEVDDLAAQKLAKDIAKRIQDELKYPGEIKVMVVREKRVIEYAK